MVCTFFGHRDTPGKIEPILKSALIDLITNQNVDKFYVGNEGNFDYMARRLLKELKVNYPHINYAVVLAYMPGKRGEFEADYSDTVYPECLADVPRRFAISKRNIWMIDRADCVLTYIAGVTGGAFKFKQLAEKRGRTVINLVDLCKSWHKFRPVLQGRIAMRPITLHPSPLATPSPRGRRLWRAIRKSTVGKKPDCCIC